MTFKVPPFLLIFVSLITATIAQADHPLVFISAFASCEKADIHAFQFDAE